MAKITLIITTKNEIHSIDALMQSIVDQTRKPDEVVIVDSKSSDGTYERLTTYWKKHIKTLVVISKKCYRAEGRNIAISKASSSLIVITDAGCILDKHWLERIISPLEEKRCDCVSGYYAYKKISPIKEAMAAFMLVLPSKVNKDDFLPATRSMALTKEAWEKAGKFPEDLYSSEDYIFAHRLVNTHVRIQFVKDAIVFWSPPESMFEFTKKIYEFAYHDIRGGVFRKKILLIYLRYLLFTLVGFIHVGLFLLLLIVYGVWSMQKHYKDISSKSLLYVPILQIISDATVMFATVKGYIS